MFLIAFGVQIALFVLGFCYIISDVIRYKDMSNNEWRAQLTHAEVVFLVICFWPVLSVIISYKLMMLGLRLLLKGKL